MKGWEGRVKEGSKVHCNPNPDLARNPGFVFITLLSPLGLLSLVHAFHVTLSFHVHLTCRRFTLLYIDSDTILMQVMFVCQPRNCTVYTSLNANGIQLKTLSRVDLCVHDTITE
jgi:hypothetical protein